MSNDTLLISAAETAKLLNISKPLVYQLAKRSDFPAVQIGERILIHRLSLESWVNEHLGDKVL